MRWWLLALPALLGCTQAYTLQEAARTEVYTTATCPSVEISHVPASDVASEREDVYLAEGCGMRWRMACDSQEVEICPRHSRRPCRTRVAWSCAGIQPDEPFLAPRS